MTATDTDLAALATSLPDSSVLTDPDVTETYRQDWARDPAAGHPLAVVRATTTEDVAATLRWATAHRVPVVPRGAGSGLSGGATAVDGGIVLSLEKMRAVTIDPAMRIAVAQPGALNVEVKAAAAKHGLWYPPDPSSFEMCSIGGNAATNSGGLCCVKYGVTTDYVLGMQVVLADGAVLRLGGPRLKDSAGLSLTKLFVGSEGMLGVITELTLRLLPAQPPASTLVASFGSIEAAADAVLAIISKLRPSTLELMDNASINAVEDYVSMGLDRSAQALLLARSDAPGAAAAEEIAMIEEACRSCGAAELFTTDDPDEGEAYAAARRAAFPALERKGDLLLEDVGVPLPALPVLVGGVQHAPADRLRRIGPRSVRPSAARVRRDHGAGHLARRHDHRRARRRAVEEGLAAGLPRPGRAGADQADQGCARPRRHPQPRRRALRARKLRSRLPRSVLVR